MSLAAPASTFFKNYWVPHSHSHLHPQPHLNPEMHPCVIEDEAKKVWLAKQKGRRRRWEEEKIVQKVKWWKTPVNSVVTSHVGGLGNGKNWKSSQQEATLVTYVGWEMGEAENVVNRKLLGSSLVYNYTKCEF